MRRPFATLLFLFSAISPALRLDAQPVCDPDTTAPSITCPSNITVSAASDSCTATVNYTTPTATDACDPNPQVVCLPASGSAFSQGTTQVTCTATDASNNTSQCTFTVTVNDTTAPQITCPANIVQGTDPNACTATVQYTTPTATDNCGTPDVVCVPASGSSFPQGTTTVTCTATDLSQNTAQCTFSVTVNDTQAPSLVCPADIIVTPGANACSAVVRYSTPAASDNCGSASVVCAPASGSSFPTGTTAVTCTATDADFNSSQCSFNVTVNETQAPSITCPADITVSAASDACSAVVHYTTPTASDACDAASVQCAPASGSTFPLGQTTVTCTATNPGNSSQCTFTVTVNDTTPPTITCPADMVVVVAPNGTEKVVDYPAPDVGDNCPGATAQCVPASGSTFPIGDTVVHCTATDAHQNTSDCTFTISVRPNPIVPTLDPRALVVLAAAIAGAGALLARRP